MEILVGHTGFVGSNIASEHRFDLYCNSKNITEAYGTHPDLLVYAGVPAEMFLANRDPDADRNVTRLAAENIQKINPERLVLISTIAVLDNPIKVDETVSIDQTRLSAYGLNRLELELSVTEIVQDHHIVRLPALFGQGIKKNFIYDMINFFPALLSQAKYEELSRQEPIISRCYSLQNNGFYKLELTEADRIPLKSALTRVGFSALNFTDSRAVFQFYNLAHLWGHIETIVKCGIPLFHAATEPISAGEVYEHIYGTTFVNEISEHPLKYDFRTMYSDQMGGRNGYILDAQHVLDEITGFIKQAVSATHQER